MKYILAPVPKLQFIDYNGNPLAAGTLWTYAAGTDTLLATAQDVHGQPNSNPILLDSAGRAPVWLNSELAYKFVLKAEDGDIVYTVDNINDPAATGVTYVETIADLREDAAYNGKTVYVSGHSSVNDGGGGVFYYDSSSILSEDSGIVITPSSSPTTGRWIRYYSDEINVRWFGAKGDGITDDSESFTLADSFISDSGLTLTLFAPFGEYLLQTNPNMDNSIKLNNGAAIKISTITIDIKPIIANGDESIHFIITGSGKINIALMTILPEWFGAKGDGSLTSNAAGTEDTDAIQKSIESCSIGSWVQFDSKKKYWTDTLTLKSGVNLKGSQPYTVNNYTSSLQYIGTGGDLLDCSNAAIGGIRGVSIIDLVLDGNAQASNVIKIETVGSLIERCTIRNANIGILLGGSDISSNNRIHKCNFSTLTTGIKNTITDYGSINGIISDNMFDGVTAEINLGQYSGWIISNNKLTNGNTLAQRYGSVFGNAAYVTSTETANIRDINDKILGANINDVVMLSTLGGIADNSSTHTASSNVWNRKYLRRNSSTSTFDGARLHDALGQDTTNLTPKTDTRAWYERDFGDGTHHWGDNATEKMALSNTIVNVSPDSILSVGGISFGGDTPVVFSGIKVLPILMNGDLTEATMTYQILGKLISLKFRNNYTTTGNTVGARPTYRYAGNNPIPEWITTAATILENIATEQTITIPVPTPTGYGYNVGDYIVVSNVNKSTFASNWYNQCFGWGIVAAYNPTTGSMTIQLKLWHDITGAQHSITNAFVLAAWPWFNGYYECYQPFVNANNTGANIRITPVDFQWATTPGKLPDQTMNLFTSYPS